jgi:hypothetical protein
MRIPLIKATVPGCNYVQPQYLFDAGMSYVQLSYDVFVEYSLEAFNNFFGPLKIKGANGDPTKVMEIWFPENPMYATIGGRIRYNNGMELYLCAPFLLSQNIGSAMTSADNTLLNRGGFPEETARGINSAFDPWFAQWKVVVQLTFPLVYKQTGSEMMRNFLLLKGASKEQKFDIDDELKKNGATGDAIDTSEKEKKARLDEINKRREQMEKSE